MKNLFKILASVLLASFVAAAAHAESAQITTLTTSAPKIIMQVGNVKGFTISNIGSNAVNITWDGGSTAGGTDPTTGVGGIGQPLAAGQTLSFYGPPLQGKNIVAIMQSGTTILNIQGEAPKGTSVFPTP
jgi:hypothetical protein